MKRALMMLLAVLATGCSSQIQHGLDEKQANEIKTALSEHGIEAQKIPEPGRTPSWAIEVDQSRSTEAVRLLSQLGLPRTRPQGFAELFGKSSLVPTATEERVKYEEALSGELARTLESMDGVSSARVLLVVPPSPRPGQPARAAKASAFVRVQPEAVERIRQEKADLQALIAGSVDGLSADAVTLVIDEVVAPKSLPPKVAPDARWRIAVVGLGALVSVMGLLVLLLALKLRRSHAEPAPVGEVSTSKQRPVATAQRRAA